MRLLRNRHCSSSRKISSIEYEQTNLSLLPKLYALGCEKTQLQAHMKQNLTEICPNLDQSKAAFQTMQGRVEGLYQLIKNKVLTERDSELDSDFFQRAHYYFEKEGKKVRPLMITILAENFKQVMKKQHPQLDFTRLDADITKWCALIEIMHIASLAHDDIVDDSPSRRGQQSQHLKYGPKVAVFSGNYVISKASKTVSEFNSARLYEIYAYTMASLAEGEIKQLLAKKQNKFTNDRDEKGKTFEQMIQRYMQKTYFKSAALMCGSLLGVPSIFHLHFGAQLCDSFQQTFQCIEDTSFRVGQHYGLALQLIDDILDYVSTAQEMGKEEMSDLVQGNVTAPVYFTYLHKDGIEETGSGVSLELLNRRKKSKEDAMKVKTWVESGVGIELTYVLGAMHALEGLKQLGKLGLQDKDLLAWRYLGYRLMTRRK